MGRRLGNYDVRGLIGCGAMGAVYLAHDAVLDRPVALKVLLGSLARSPEQVRRFQREARAAAPLSHPNIVRIYEAGVRQGIPFMAMEYVDGESFDRFLARSGPLPWRHALEVAAQMARALACAHEHGVTHRDVKPSNMLLDRKGRLRLTDFGIARIRDQSTGLTEHDLFLGTPEFMSPEQCAGARDIGPATDLFSLGVTIYRMISGRMPFAGFNTAALIAAITHETPPRLNRICAEVPDDVARLVAHLLEKSPDARPESAEAVAEAIENLLESDGGNSVMSAALEAFIRDQAEPRELEFWTPTPGEKPARKTRRPMVRQNKRRRFYAPVSLAARLAASVVAALALAGAGYWYLAGTPDPVTAAPLLNKAVFVPQQPGVYLMDLPASGWDVAELAWTPRGEALLARLEGRSDTLLWGSSGILRVSPGDGSMRSLSPPANPWRDAEAASALVRQPLLQAVLLPGWDTANGLAGEGYLLRAARLGGDHVVLLPQPAGAAHPLSTPLVVVEGAAWGTDPQDPHATPRPGEALFSPAGDRLVVARASAQGPGYDLLLYPLVEEPTEAPKPLKMQSFNLIPGGLCFAPDGRHLYVLSLDQDGRALYRLDCDGGRAERVLRADIVPPLSIAPDGQTGYAAIDSAAGREIFHIDLQGSGGATPLGRGALSRAPLLPRAQGLLACVDEGAASRLFRIDATQAGRRFELARFEGGRLREAVASPSGRWAAAVLDQGGVSRLALVDLEALTARTAPQAMEAPAT